MTTWSVCQPAISGMLRSVVYAYLLSTSERRDNAIETNAYHTHIHQPSSSPYLIVFIRTCSQLKNLFRFHTPHSALLSLPRADQLSPKDGRVP